MIDLDLAAWIGPWAYVAVFLAAAIEGEVVFVTAAALVAAGHLSGIGVFVAGVSGAAVGDQLWFHLLRLGPRRWLEGRLRPGARSEAVRALIRRHQTLMILAIRFVPGLRVAVTAACVWAAVPPWRFSLVITAGAVLWASLVLAGVAWAGPAVFNITGVRGWGGAIVAGLVIVVAFRWGGSALVRPRGGGASPIASRERQS